MSELVVMLAKDLELGHCTAATNNESTNDIAKKVVELRHCTTSNVGVSYKDGRNELELRHRTLSNVGVSYDVR